MKRRFLRASILASCSIVTLCLASPSISRLTYDVSLAEISPSQTPVSKSAYEVSLAQASPSQTPVTGSAYESFLTQASPSQDPVSNSTYDVSRAQASLVQAPAGNYGRKPCDKDISLYARLRSYYRADKNHAELPCNSDDGLCLNRCSDRGDNDCRILASLRLSHDFLLSRKTAEGYTPDPRDSLFRVRSEYYRLVPCMQAQGYLNLYTSTGERTFLDEACSRLDFIASHLEDALSHTCYDGQLGWAFLDAYKMTCNERYLGIGLQLAQRCPAYDSRVLNWGLLAAMNLFRGYEITGTELYLDEATDIVTRTLGFQNPDGSFPHQATIGARNLPYTSWLAHELLCYAGTGPAELTGAIDKIGSLLDRQISPSGRPVYFSDSLVVVSIPDPICVKCASKPGRECPDYCATLCGYDPELLPCQCITDPRKECPRIDSLMNLTYYDEESADYDVRGWTSELPSTAFVLDRTGRLEGKWKILDFLFSLQNADGSFPDKWGFMPKPTDSMWEYASDGHSVIRTSCVFFYLSGLMRAPEGVGTRSLAAASAGDAVSSTGGVGVGAALAPGTVSASGGGEVAAASTIGTVSTTAGAELAAVDSVNIWAADDPSTTVKIQPNPFFGTAMISFEGGASGCDITIVDVGGRVVRELAEGVAGSGTVLWDGLDDAGNEISPGVYFVNVTSGVVTTSTKVVLLRELS